MDKNAFWAKLAALGEDQVRENVGLGLYREKREKWAKEWLRQQEQERTNNMRTLWYITPPGIIIIAIIAGLCVAYLSYRFGWLSAPTQ